MQASSTPAGAMMRTLCDYFLKLIFLSGRVCSPTWAEVDRRLLVCTEKYCVCFFTGRIAPQGKCLYLIYSNVVFVFFTPLLGRYVRPIKMKFGTEKVTAKFHLDRCTGGIW